VTTTAAALPTAGGTIRTLGSGTRYSPWGAAVAVLAVGAILLRRRSVLFAFIAFLVNLAVFSASVALLLDGGIVEHVHATHAVLVLAVAVAGALAVIAPGPGRATGAPAR
jgi:hypothetical protein